jgi:hypothetical protein
MDDYESDEDGYSDASSIGSDLDDPQVDFLPVTLSMCQALYSPSSIGRTYVCTRQPPGWRHNHQSATTPRGSPGIYPLDRARTGRVRGILDGRLTDDEVTAMREREREANRALTAAQAGMQSPRRAPPESARVETASPSTGEDAVYTDVRPHRGPEDFGLQAPIADPKALIQPPTQGLPPTHAEQPRQATAPTNEEIPTADVDTREDLTNLVAQLTSALIGLNTHLERLEAPAPPAPAPAPLAPAPPAARAPHRASESILRTASTKTAATTPPEVEFKGRSPRDIGIYDNWLVVQPLVTGISFAVFKKFKTESEAE